MQPEERPDEERARAQMEMYLDDPLWQFPLVETDLHFALDMDSGKTAMGDSQEEALEQLNAIAPDAVNVRCERVWDRVRR